jgi:predicted HAD superfamily phosphohydrolase
MLCPSWFATKAGAIPAIRLTRLLEYFEEEGDDKKLEIIKQVSPVAWHNINLNGTYSFSFEQNPLDLDEIMQSIVQNEN